MTTEILQTFTNEFSGMQALVSANIKGFAVALKDLDSGETLPTIAIFPTLDRALAWAKEVQVGA